MLQPEDVERILTQGRAARRLLADDDYVGVMNALSDEHLASMVACPPGPAAKDERDHHHLVLHALREIHSEIAMRARAADDLERDLATQDDE